MAIFRCFKDKQRQASICVFTKDFLVNSLYIWSTAKQTGDPNSKYLVDGDRKIVPVGVSYINEYKVTLKKRQKRGKLESVVRRWKKMYAADTNRLSWEVTESFMVTWGVHYIAYYLTSIINIWYQCKVCCKEIYDTQFCIEHNFERCYILDYCPSVGVQTARNHNFLQ